MAKDTIMGGRSRLWQVVQYLFVFVDCVGIRVVIGIRSYCWEGLKEMLILTISAILILPLIDIFSL